MSPDWLSRYRDGQRALVWHELRQLGAAVREPGLIEETRLVCDEMATRARRNIDVILGRLREAGYRFHQGDDQTPVTPHFPPTASAGKHARWLEERFGPAPLTLLSWVRIVGDVWLVGTHPGWPQSEAADPLVITAEWTDGRPCTRERMEGQYELWEERRDEDPAAGPFVMPLAPDRFHKHGVSGGGAYGVLVPDASAEGIFVAETEMPFVSYLNLVFSCGGFPYPGRRSNDGWQVKKSLAAGLLPL